MHLFFEVCIVFELLDCLLLLQNDSCSINIMLLLNKKTI